MRWSTRRVTAALASSAVATGAVWYASRPAPAPVPEPLPANAFNALQNQSFLAEAFRPSQLPWAPRADGHGSRATLFRLLGCPYCAKVEWVLRFHRVPFDVVEVDPVTGAGLPDPRYRLAPQLRLTARESAEAFGDEALVVDSQHIIAAVAVPLGFDAELRDPRVAGTCAWISERFQGVSFAAINGNMRDAFATYAIVTPQRYQNIAFRIVGSGVLCALSRYKIQPNLAKRAGTPEAPIVKDTDAWLQDELAEFASRRGNHLFHGGNKPDLADVEMYGVTRVVGAHPRLGKFLREGPIGEWHTAMTAEVQKRVA